MKKKNFDKITFASPLEVRHFILDIPIMKKSYQYNAVKFSLKSLYPGNEDTTSVDYYCSKNKVIGIAANSEKISSILRENGKLISPSLVIQNTIKNGIILSLGKNWMDLQIIKNGDPQYLKAFSSNLSEICLEELNKLQVQYKNDNLPVKTLIFEEVDPEICAKIREIGFFPEKSTNIFSPRILNSSSIFLPKKKHKNSLVSSILVAYIVILTVLAFSLHNKASKTEKEAELIKTEYNNKKQEIYPLKIIETSKSTNVVHCNVSVYSILSEISECSPDLRILSLNISENTFRFEAEKANAISVLENIANSNMFYEVILHQSIPQKDGTERFLISGKIQND